MQSRSLTATEIGLLFMVDHAAQVAIDIEQEEALEWTRPMRPVTEPAYALKRYTGPLRPLPQTGPLTAQ